MNFNDNMNINLNLDLRMKRVNFSEFCSFHLANKNVSTETHKLREYLLNSLSNSKQS